MTTVKPKQQVADKALGLWFKARMADVQLSLSQVARLMDLDKAAVSRMIHRQRDIRTPEMHRLAEILGVPVPEIERRLGIKSARQETRATGIIRADGHAATLKNGPPVTLPPGLPEGSQAFICETNGSELNLFDGWVFFMGPKMIFRADLMGRMGLFQLENNSKWIFGRAEKGNLIGKWHIFGIKKFENVEIKSAKIARWALLGAF